MHADLPRTPGGPAGFGGLGVGGGCGMGVGLGWGWGAAYGSNYIQIDPEFESVNDRRPRWLGVMQVSYLQSLYRSSAPITRP